MSHLTTILTQMSSAFNNQSSEKTKVVSLTDDTTLKWRGLLNNTYASKESKYMRSRSESFKEKSGENSSASTISSSTTTTATNTVEEEQCKVDVVKETSSKAEQKQENSSVEKSSQIICETESHVEKEEKLGNLNVEEELDKSASNKVMVLPINVLTTTDKTATTATTTNDKLNDKKPKVKSTRQPLDKSDRSLRSKGSVVVSLGDDSTSSTASVPTNITKENKDAPKEEMTKNITSSNNNSNNKKITSELNVEDDGVAKKVEIPKESHEEIQNTPIKRGRGRRRKILPVSEPDKTSDPIPIEAQPKKLDNEIQIESQVDAEKPRLIVKIRQNRSTSANPVVIPSDIIEENKPQIDVIVVQKSPKKRGRRPRHQILLEENAQISTRSKKEEIPIRPLRRIKPTAKILASEELREGFVQQNCARLNITNEELQSMEAEAAQKSSNETELDKRITRRRRDTSLKDEPKSKEKTPPVTTNSENSAAKKGPSSVSSVESHEVKRSLSFSDTSSSSKISYAPMPPIPPRKPCPDPIEFLKEIKNSKLILPKSPEDNKKLNKKQHKRLLKMKEKHFHMLGLIKARKTGGATDTEDGSDENDEFLPARKVAVGKPGVTLRLRNFRKDERRGDENIMVNPAAHSHRKRKNKERNENGENIKKALIIQTPSASTSAPPPMVALPSANASMTVSETIDVDDLNLICLCVQPSKYFLQRTAAISHCCAIDEVEGQKIGCTNEIHGDLLQLLRPSVRTSYMVLCESHKKRLISHNCCAGCGVFLTQGIFSLCPNKHFFHRDCTMKYILNAPYDPNSTDFTGPTLAFKCPHCGVDVPDSSFRVTMKCDNVPVFFTNQKHHVHRAKMTITNRPPVSSNSFLLNVERLIPDTVPEALRSASNKLKTEPPKVFTAKDFFNAIYNETSVEKVAEIIASGFDLTKPFKEFHNGTCLHLVSNFGNITILYMILCRIMSIDFINALDKEKRTAVMCAVMGRKNDILKVLVQFGADVTLKGPDGMTALHLAAKVGNFAAAQILLDYYRQTASFSKTEKLLNMTDSGQWTALVWAAENGHADIVSYFVSLGADVNVCDYHNNTVLHWAALSGKIDTIYPLMLPNTLYNTQNINGDTALHIACRQSNTRVCLVLVANGANLYTRNDAGEIPIDCIPDENSQCARVLRFNMEIRGLGNYKERKVLCHDISNGREMYPIQMLQRLGNDEAIITFDFKYITKNIILQNAVQIDMRTSQMRVCSCSDSCVTENCQCGQISIQNWYNTDGRLIGEFNYDDPAMIFECNDVCGCNIMLCKNRVVQRGIKLPLQVFECDDTTKGFGVQALSKIQKGTFIAEYIGEILTDAEADRRTDDSFFFDLGASEHCIDAKFYGNISRFFNHSCEANVVPIRVYFEHQDIRFPKIAFFANRDIEPDEEITFDYGTKFWLAKYKQFTCHCKSSRCRYSDTAILKTLEEYNQKNITN